MGGGFPCAAFGGRRDRDGAARADGPVYQAGTLSGNPVAVAAGIAALDLADGSEPYDALERHAVDAHRRSRRAVRRRGIAAAVNRAASMFSVFFTDRPGAQLRGREGRRPRAVRALLPPHAGPRRVPAAVRLRAVEPLHRTRRRRRPSERSRPRRRSGLLTQSRPQATAGRSAFLADVDAVDVRRDAVRPRRLPEPVGDGAHAAADADPIPLQRERRGVARERKDVRIQDVAFGPSSPNTSSRSRPRRRRRAGRSLVRRRRSRLSSRSAPSVVQKNTGSSTVGSVDDVRDRTRNGMSHDRYLVGDADQLPLTHVHPPRVGVRCRLWASDLGAAHRGAGPFRAGPGGRLDRGMRGIPVGLHRRTGAVERPPRSTMGGSAKG